MQRTIYLGLLHHGYQATRQTGRRRNSDALCDAGAQRSGTLKRSEGGQSAKRVVGIDAASGQLQRSDSGRCPESEVELAPDEWGPKVVVL